MIKFIKGDLFTIGKEVPLVHCVSADFALGAGIAKQFRNKFPDMIKAMNASPTPNVTDIFPFRTDDTRHKLVLNLITKERFFFKPTRENFNRTLMNLHSFLVENDIKTIAMPRIGAGLDRLNWSETEVFLKEHFSDIDVIVFSI